MSNVIHLFSKRIFNASDAQVFELLKAHKTFSEWWPEKMQVNASGMGEQGEFDIMFHPTKTISIAWKLAETITNEMVTYKYVKGPFIGEGIWKIHQINNEAHVSYSIYLEPKSFFFALASKTAYFSKKHQREIETLFDAMDLRLKDGAV